MKKAVGFFCAVFVSMLAVFLLVTGEVARWFGDEDKHGSVRIHRNLPARETDAGSNLLTFDYFDVKRGRINFTIRAEFSQESLPDKIEEMREIRLSDGVIEIPIHHGLKLPGKSRGDAERGAAEPSERMRQFVLHFKTALYEKNDAKGHRVFLKDGYGTANDGTEIFFEDLIFRQRSPDGADGYEIRSEQPVTIRNAALDLTSPNGLDGSLRNTGLEELVFRPPVSALVGAADALALGERGDSGDGESSKVAVTCQGPLEVRFEQKAKADGEVTLPTRSEIRFQKDVVLYTVPGAAEAAALPEPGGTRFECQDLRLELTTLSGEDGDRLVPRRAVATWPDGRVKGFFSKGDDAYAIDGSELIWENAAGDATSGEFVLGGEAVLSGRPTVRRTSGDGLFFVAELARIRPLLNNVLFETVTGTLTFGEGVDLPVARRRSPPEGSRGRPRRRGAPRREAPAGGYPQTWSLKAEEVEFRFREGEETGRKELAEIEARSDGAPGSELVTLESLFRPEHKVSAEGSEAGSSGQPGSVDATPLRVVARQLTYREAERSAVLEGGPDGKPRLEAGDNWIAARRIRLSADRGDALFEDEAHAYVADVQGLGRISGSSWENAEAGKMPATFEMHAPTLEVGFVRQDDPEAEGQDLELGFLHAYGAPGTSGQVTARTLADPWYRLTGGEIYWDQLAGEAWLYGRARRLDSEGSVVRSAPSLLESEGSASARVDLEGGSLLAQEIHFDQRDWRAFLSDRVTIYATGDQHRPGGEGWRPPQPGEGALEMRTGSAEVEFYPQLQQGALPMPALGELARVRRVHATRGAAPHIEIRGTGFVGKAEELEWSGEEQTLRFQGAGRQEIELLREDFEGPLYAREVVYEAATGEVVLRGNVEARLTQLGSLDTGGGTGTQSKKKKKRKLSDPLVWWLETDALEIETRPLVETGSRLELVSLRARDKVRIQEKSHGLLFRGDELFYAHEQRKIHIYSPDGRSQTLFREPPAAVAGTETEKIQAQEIWVMLTPAPASVAAAGGPQEWLQVDFERDVIAKFQLPQESSVRKSIEGVGQQLTMDADRLTLSIDPREDPQSPELVPSARARGKVNFHSGEFEGSSDLAVLDQDAGELILLGTSNAPARLLRRGQALSTNQRILLRKNGRTWDFYD